MTIITDELFARFMDGDVSPEEAIEVHRAMKEDKELMGLYISTKRFDAMTESDDSPELPLERMAAKAEDNLCDILCERYILWTKFPEYGSRSILGDAKNEQSFLRQAKTFNEKAWIEDNKLFFTTDLEKQWLTKNGVALYNVGRIMEGYGLSVTRHFDSNIKNIRRFLDLGESLIAIVNEEILDGASITDVPYPNHAVCILALDDVSITTYNPSKSEDSVSYPIELFIKAWDTSRNYLVAVGKPGEKVYDPCPINLDDVEIDDNLNDLIDAIAENAHDVWAYERMKQGYIYAPENNSDPEKGPLANKDLRPYSELPETEKDYDRKMAISTLKLATRLGFKIVHPDSEDDYHCSACGKRISLVMSYCPYCGRQLQLSDFI